jgi:hypothetical protein
LDALKQLPGLVKVSVVSQASWYIEDQSPRIVTLPHVQEMHICAFDIEELEESAAVPPILQFLKLPKATSIAIQSRFSLYSNQSILPITSFGEQLPNYVELPELRINTTMVSGEAVFRRPSGVVFTYKTGKLNDYKWDRLIWGNLPVSSVRRVTAVLVDPAVGDEDVTLRTRICMCPSPPCLQSSFS